MVPMARKAFKFLFYFIIIRYMGSTLARGLKEFITYMFSSSHPEDEYVQLYYSKKHEKSPLTPILGVTIHEPNMPGLGPVSTWSRRLITGIIYRRSESQANLYITDDVFSTRVNMYDINGIMRGIQGAQAAFRRATKIGPLTRLELIGDADMPFFSRATSDAPEFRRFLAWRVKRELKRRARVTAAGATLRQRGVPRNVAQLILRRVGRGGAARQ